MNIFIGNLSFDATREDLKKLFEPFGSINSAVVVMVQKKKPKSRGFGFVEMLDENQAQAAIAALNGQEFMGRPMVVNPARTKEEQEKIDMKKNHFLDRRTDVDQEYKSPRRTRHDSGLSKSGGYKRERYGKDSWRKKSVEPQGYSGENHLDQMNKHSQPWKNQQGEARPWRRSESDSRRSRSPQGESRPWKKIGGEFSSSRRSEGGSARPWKNFDGDVRSSRSPQGESRPWKKTGGGSKPWQDGHEPWKKPQGESKPWKKSENNARPWGKREGHSSKPWEKKAGYSQKPWKKSSSESRPWKKPGDGSHTRYASPKRPRKF